MTGPRIIGGRPLNLQEEQVVRALHNLAAGRDGAHDNRARFTLDQVQATTGLYRRRPIGKATVRAILRELTRTATDHAPAIAARDHLDEPLVRRRRTWGSPLGYYLSRRGIELAAGIEHRIVEARNRPTRRTAR